MNWKPLIFGCGSLIFGLGALIHHKIVAGVWYSTNQTFYECHGIMGIITMGWGAILLSAKFIWNGGVFID